VVLVGSILSLASLSEFLGDVITFGYLIMFGYSLIYLAGQPAGLPIRGVRYRGPTHDPGSELSRTLATGSFMKAWSVLPIRREWVTRCIFLHALTAVWLGGLIALGVVVTIKLVMNMPLTATSLYWAPLCAFTFSHVIAVIAASSSERSGFWFGFGLVALVVIIGFLLFSFRVIETTSNYSPLVITCIGAFLLLVPAAFRYLRKRPE
jgi:hypothetical protein